MSRAEAKAAIDTLKGKSYTNRETGISARLSSTGAGKLIGNAATGKTQANGFSKEQHNALAAMIDELFENAYFVSSKPNDDGDKNIASIKRFVCPVTVADTEAGAYITIKESVQHGHRIYSVEGIKIEELSPMVRRVIADRNAAESSSSFSLPQSAYVVNVGTRFSISAQEDADYLAAVKRGDMETGIRHSIGGLYTGAAVDRYGIGLARTVIPEEQNRDIRNLYIQASQNIPMLKDIAHRLCAKSVIGTASFRFPNREENDHVKQGGTLNELRKYIQSRGGKVVAVTTLTASLFSDTLAINRDAEIGLYEKFGNTLDEELRTAGIANGVAELTQSQARELLKLRVDTFRDRIAQARLARQRKLDAQAVRLAGRSDSISGRADNVGTFGEEEAGIRHSIGGLYTGTAVDRYGIGLARTVIPEEQNRDIQNLYIQASQNIPMLKDIAYRLCAISVMGTASFRLPNREENDLQVKKRDKIIEKANRLYGGDVSQVVDIIAATVTLSTEDSYIDSLSSIDSETG